MKEKKNYQDEFTDVKEVRQSDDHVEFEVRRLLRIKMNIKHALGIAAVTVAGVVACKVVPIWVSNKYASK